VRYINFLAILCSTASMHDVMPFYEGIVEHFHTWKGDPQSALVDRANLVPSMPDRFLQMAFDVNANVLVTLEDITSLICSSRIAGSFVTQPSQGIVARLDPVLR